MMARIGDGRSTERVYEVVCPSCKGGELGRQAVEVASVGVTNEVEREG